MKYSLLAIITFFFFILKLSAQEKKFTYIQFDVGLSLTGNPDYGDAPEYEGDKQPWLLPDGLGSKLGYGVHYKQWLTLGVHSGLDWKWNEKLVAVPVYLNLGLRPKIAENTRITMEVGYGRSFALGRGDLSGTYKKARLGLTVDDHTIFLEVADFGFPLHEYNSIGSVSFGFSLISF
ncbi:hypothetical protein [Flavobacterium aquidurense]|uniref:hypothetical protein n=1 Tax=Flavobacterium aquidurense TaxID=362413 RepID=UPI002861ECC5|nr:hypothetical protein [Flavobacterium aquidurense]MDR7372550.1 hypothetical protein [Flavobacterium aquidurense]